MRSAPAPAPVEPTAAAATRPERAVLPHARGASTPPRGAARAARAQPRRLQPAGVASFV